MRSKKCSHRLLLAALESCLVEVIGHVQPRFLSNCCHSSLPGLFQILNDARCRNPSVLPNANTSKVAAINQSDDKRSRNLHYVGDLLSREKVVMRHKSH